VDKRRVAPQKQPNLALYVRPGYAWDWIQNKARLFCENVVEHTRAVLMGDIFEILVPRRALLLWSRLKQKCS